MGLPGMTRNRMVGQIEHKGDVTDIKFMSENFLLSTSSYGHLNVYRYTKKSNQLEPDKDSNIQYDLENLMNKQLHNFPNNVNAEATAIAIQPRETTNPEILTAGEDGNLVFLRLVNPNDSQTIKADTSTIKAILWPIPNQIITASSSGMLKIFDNRSTQKPTCKFYDLAHPRDPINCLASATSSIHEVAAGSSNGFITLWDVRNLKGSQKQIRPHQTNIWELLYYSDDKILSCSEDGSIVIMDLHKSLPTEKITNKYQRFSINSIDYHESTNILVGGGDSTYILMGELDL